MYQSYQDLFVSTDDIQTRLRRVIRERDGLIQQFDKSIGGLRLPMRLRRRSGGLLSWRNIAVRGQDQRDTDLTQYQKDLEILPQPIRIEILDFDKKRILINVNLSMLQHEKKQVDNALKKIGYNTSIFEPMNRKEALS